MMLYEFGMSWPGCIVRTQSGSTAYGHTSSEKLVQSLTAPVHANGRVLYMRYKLAVCMSWDIKS